MSFWTRGLGRVVNVGNEWFTFVICDTNNLFFKKKIGQIEMSVLVLKNEILYAKWNERELWKMVFWHTG